MERQFADLRRVGAGRPCCPLRARDFRLPPEIYAFGSRQYGIDLPPESWSPAPGAGSTRPARRWTALAPQVAPSSARRDRLSSGPRRAQEAHDPNDQMEAHYAEVLGQIQQIAARERIVTLPDYPVLMRLGTDAENAASPAPHMNPPRPDRQHRRARHLRADHRGLSRRDDPRQRLQLRTPRRGR
jgi:hypothetical protein